MMSSRISRNLPLAFLSVLFSSTSATENASNRVLAGCPSVGINSLESIQSPLVPNRGQAPADVRFLARGETYSIAFMDDGFVTRMSAPDSHSDGAIRFRFVGASENARLRSGRAGSALVHYLIGRDASTWRTALPTYEQIVYDSLYPGIELAFESRPGTFESVFRVSGDGQPSQIRIRCNGAKSLQIDAEGSLLIRAEHGVIRQSRPVAYQLLNGIRRELPARFVLAESARAFGISVQGPWDPQFPLVIDPIYGFVSYLGGTSEDEAYAVAVDSAGQLYVAGYTRSSDFPTQGGVQASSGGLGDAFVAKVSGDGKSLVYATYLGGSDRDLAFAIAVDALGQVHVTGETSSADFPVAPQSNSSRRGAADVFLTKLAANGQTLLASSYLGGTGFDAATAIALDSGGRVYIAGVTFSSDFPTRNAYQSVLRGVQDAFVARFDSDALTSTYSTYLGGSGLDGAAGIAVDSSGRAHIAGSTSSTNFPTVAAYQAGHGGLTDGFVARLSADGRNLVYSTYLGGSDDDAANALLLDASGNAYITGYTRSTDYPIASAFQSAHKGGTDAFMTRLSSDGSTVSLSTFLGGAGHDEGTAVARDTAGQVYIAGMTSSEDFPIAGGLQISISGESDAFLSQFTPGGQGLQFSSYIGGSSDESAYGLAVDSSGKMFVVGSTRSTNLRTQNSKQATFGGGSSDAFYARIDPFEPAYVSTLFFPRLVTSEGMAGDPNTSEYTGVAVANLSSASATLKFSAYDTAGVVIGGSGIANPSFTTLDGPSQISLVDSEVFGAGLPSRKPRGWFKLESTVKETVGFFLIFNSTLTVLDGADVTGETVSSFVFPEIEDLGFTQLHIANAGSATASLTLELMDSSGNVRATATPPRTVAANGVLVESVSTIFPGQTVSGGMYVRGTSTQPVSTFEYLGRSGMYAEGLKGLDPSPGAKVVYSPQYVAGGGYRTTLSVVNFENAPTTVLLRLIGDGGNILGASRIEEIPARGKVQITAQNYFVTPTPSSLTQGYLQLTSDRTNIGGSVVFGDPARTTFSSALPLVSKPQTSSVFSQVASDGTYFTGVAALNPGDRNATYVVDVYDRLGKIRATKSLSLEARRRSSQLLTQIFPALPSLSSGYFRITSSEGLLSFALFGTHSLTVLSAVPPQVVP